MWLENSRCRDTVVGTWGRSTSGSPMERVIAKLEACQGNLTQWSKHSFCHVKKEITDKKRLLEAIERDAAQGGGISHNSFSSNQSLSTFSAWMKRCGSSKVRSIGWCQGTETPILFIPKLHKDSAAIEFWTFEIQMEFLYQVMLMSRPWLELL